MRHGDRVKVAVPRNTALGDLLRSEEASLRRTCTVLDPQLRLLDFGIFGQHEVPEEWIKARLWAEGDIVRWHESERHPHNRARVERVNKNGTVRVRFPGAEGVGWECYTVRPSEIVRY